MNAISEGDRLSSQNLAPNQSRTIASQSQVEIENALSDDEDLILSQALDDIERAQTIVAKKDDTELKKPEQRTKGLSLNLNLPKFKRFSTQGRVNEEQQATKTNRSHQEDNGTVDMNESNSSIDAPAPKIQKTANNQADRSPVKFGLNRFAFVAPKNPNKENSVPTPIQSNQKESDASAAGSSENTQPLNQSVRNRIFCTPSDDENSQSQPSNRKRLNLAPIRLDLFKSTQRSGTTQTPPHQRAIVAAGKSNESNTENDSAYDTMSFSSNKMLTGTAPSVPVGLGAQTGKTPALFPPSGPTQNPNDLDDLSFLDHIDF